MRLVFALSIGCFIAALCGVFTMANETPKDSLEAEDVLSRMSKVYADCKSYRDSGTVRTQVLPGRTLEKKFTTAFVRPNRFRFEFKVASTDRNESRYLVWQREGDVRKWWDVKPGIESAKSLDLALAEATGVSGGSAHTIPALLLPNDVGGRTLMEMTEVQRIADATLERMECFRIKGRLGDNLMTVWIDKAKFLVRRVDEDGQTTTYFPVVDEEVQDQHLEFDPPKN